MERAVLIDYELKTSSVCAQCTKNCLFTKWLRCSQTGKLKLGNPTKFLRFVENENESRQDSKKKSQCQTSIPKPGREWQRSTPIICNIISEITQLSVEEKSYGSRVRRRSPIQFDKRRRNRTNVRSILNDGRDTNMHDANDILTLKYEI